VEKDGRVQGQDRIDELEAQALAHRDRIEALEAAALDAEAVALVSDARILELAAEVENLLAAREHAGVINQAKGVLMSSMHIGPDAAFAVLVAASQRENVKLFVIAERIAASQDVASEDD
jgi:AmiR/NasT family two-component response regulator